tara:strand:- start:9561 stop:10808 length:1248 start_codon:yes stop_codon:yes gene_type:complete
MGMVNNILAADRHYVSTPVLDAVHASRIKSPVFWDDALHGDPSYRWSIEWLEEILGREFRPSSDPSGNLTDLIVSTVSFIYRACDVDGRLRVVPKYGLQGGPTAPVAFSVYFEGQPFTVAEVIVDDRIDNKRLKVYSPRIRNYRYDPLSKGHYINSTNKWSRAQEILSENIRLEPDEAIAARMLYDIDLAWRANRRANTNLRDDAVKELIFGSKDPNTKYGNYYGISSKIPVFDLPPLKELYHAIQGGYVPSDGTLAGKFSRVLELERISGAPPEAMTFVMSRYPKGAKLLVVNRVNAMQAPNQPPPLLRHRRQLVYGTPDWDDAEDWSKDMDWAHMSRLTQKVVIDPDAPYLPQVARLRKAPVALVEVSDLLQQVPVSFRDRLLPVYSLKDETEMPGWGYRHNEDNMCIYGSPY